MNTIKLSAICVCVFSVSLLNAQTYNANGTSAGNSSITGGVKNNNNNQQNKSFGW